MICHYCRNEVDQFAKRCPYCHMDPSPPDDTPAERYSGPFVLCLVSGLVCLMIAPVLGWVLLGLAILLFVKSVVR